MKTALPLALLAALALTACKQEAAAPDGKASAEASASADMAGAKAGLSAHDGKLVLPVVKGRPGAAYFMLSNSDTKPAVLAKVTVSVAAKAEAHETKGGEMTPIKDLEVKPGEMVLFERGGKHVMVFDIKPGTKPGDTAEMTLSFTDGNTLKVPLTVQDATSGADMDHGAMH